MAIDHVGRAPARDHGGSGHIAHVSSIDGLAAIERWRARGADLTCEVTPHHMLLDADVYETFGGMAKVNPPIRGRQSGSTLLAALADGRIDCLASDHAPHLLADKQRDSIWDVPAGFAGVETLLPLMLTEVARRPTESRTPGSGDVGGTRASLGSVAAQRGSRRGLRRRFDARRTGPRGHCSRRRPAWHEQPLAVRGLGRRSARR